MPSCQPVDPCATLFFFLSLLSSLLASVSSTSTSYSFFPLIFLMCLHSFNFSKVLFVFRNGLFILGFRIWGHRCSGHVQKFNLRFKLKRCVPFYQYATNVLGLNAFISIYKRCLNNFFSSHFVVLFIVHQLDFSLFKFG